MTKQILLLLIIFSSFFLQAQDYSFTKDFIKGKITLKDSSIIEGELKWFPSQNSDVKFRKNKDQKTIKYSPNEVINFSVENIKFVPLKNFTAFAEHYALIGKTSEIKETFAQVISEGKFNIFFVYITGYDPISNKIQNYENFVFQNSQDNEKKLYSYPYLIRIKEKKYENAKENLYALFKDYPQIIEKIKNYKKEDNFLEIIDVVKNLNIQ